MKRKNILWYTTAVLLVVNIRCLYESFEVTESKDKILMISSSSSKDKGRRILSVKIVDD